MGKSERVSVPMDADLRNRVEAWRAEQHAKTGRIPSLADAARVLVHIGLVADGFPSHPEGKE